MRSAIGARLSLLFLCAFAGVAIGAETAQGWQRIEVEAGLPDLRGEPLRPGCSGGPMLETTQAGLSLVAAPQEFAFFARLGDPKRLLIVWDGGGACWDSATCIDTAIAGTPIYSLALDETPEHLAAQGGIADIADPRNPLRAFTQVFIPYCTGDLHMGSKETLYDLPGGGQWPIHHRGHDNVLTVLRYVQAYYANIQRDEPEEIVLVGASAGGYGVLYALPEVSQLFPGVNRLRVLADSSNGVITEDLYARALTPEGAWGVWTHLAPELEEAFASGSDTLVVKMFQDLGWSYPRARLGQYATVLDGVQVFFYNIAKHPGAPERWLDPVELFVSGLEWTATIRAAMWTIAATTWNYRFYLGAGTGHAIIADPRFYDENSAQGVSFSGWFSDMIERSSSHRSRWKNLSCAPECLPAP